jgi:hypothetical protein
LSKYRLTALDATPGTGTIKSALGHRPESILQEVANES